MNSRPRWIGAVCLGAIALGHALTAPVAAQPTPNPIKESPPVKPSTARKLTLPETPYSYAALQLPAHFNGAAAKRFDNTPSDNRVTDAGATLGRVLFYDTRLSDTNTVACASCHHQSKAFGGPERFSKGYKGQALDRHSMTLGNLRYYARGRFFWDERAPSLEAQVLLPIQDKVEMGMDLKKLTLRLSQDEAYAELFTKAFGTKEVTSKRISKALAQFLRSMVSYRSKFDDGMNQVLSVRESFPNFSAEENRGKTLFLQRCANCHMPGNQTAHFYMNRPLNNGLDVDFRKTDGGVGDITLLPNDLGKFKSPSLRNAEYAGFYMHDGRFDSLEKVIEHYSKGVKNHPNRDGRARSFDFDRSQKASLVAFLRTLSDPHFITDPRFADPFQ